ncbi:MAG: hypothetical protein MR410_02360 [Eubacterium sp.]|nr:hypothetical protein [Eubacterium sp.]
MNYVKCIDKSKLWIALAVMAVALFICGYHVEAEENTGEGNTSIEQPSTKDFGNPELFEFSQPEDHMYTGVEICPEITVKEIVSNQTSGSGETEGSTNSSSEADPKEGENEGTQPKKKILKLNEDYTVTYSNNTNAGTAEILIQPKDTTKYSVRKSLHLQLNR